MKMTVIGRKLLRYRVFSIVSKQVSKKIVSLWSVSLSLNLLVTSVFILLFVVFYEYVAKSQKPVTSFKTHKL